MAMFKIPMKFSIDMKNVGLLPQWVLSLVILTGLVKGITIGLLGYDLEVGLNPFKCFNILANFPGRTQAHCPGKFY